VADELGEGKRPASMQPTNAAVYDYCMELSTKHEVSDATFRRLREVSASTDRGPDISQGTYITVACWRTPPRESAPGGKTPLNRCPRDKIG